MTFNFKKLQFLSILIFVSCGNSSFKGNNTDKKSDAKPAEVAPSTADVQADGLKQGQVDIIQGVTGQTYAPNVVQVEDISDKPAVVETEQAGSQQAYTPNNSCVESNYQGLTKIQLLNSTINNGDSSAYIDYKLSVRDCDDVAIDLPVAKIKFDLNVYTESGSSFVNYQLLDSTTGASFGSGSFQTIVGEDLFGKKSTGDVQAYHLQTSGQVSLQKGQKDFILRLKFAGETLKSVNGATQNFQAESFLRYGDAKPAAEYISVK